MKEHGPDAQRVVVFIDYQNVMRDARRAFCAAPYSAADGQIDPIAYGQLLTSRQPPAASGRRRLQEVRAYRGRPHSEKDARTHAAHMRQTSAWQAAGVTVVTRDLRYPRDFPKEPAEEKGIDVALAIDAVMMAVNGELDVAVLATTDTDQRPVLEAFQRLPLREPPIIEVVTWQSPRFSKKLQIKEAHVWSHLLDDAAYRRVRDSRDYNIPAGQ